MGLFDSKAKLGSIAVNLILVLSVIVVFGLSVDLARGQGENTGAPPGEIIWSCIAGGLSILLVGASIAALFMDALPELVVLVANGLAAVFLLAGGVALAKALGGLSCTATDDKTQYDRYNNKVLNGGCVKVPNEAVPVCTFREDDDLRHRCTKVQADYVFQFIGLIFALVGAGLFFLTRRRGGSGSYV